MRSFRCSTDKRTPWGRRVPRQRPWRCEERHGHLGCEEPPWTQTTSCNCCRGFHAALVSHAQARRVVDCWRESQSIPTRLVEAVKEEAHHRRSRMRVRLCGRTFKSLCSPPPRKHGTLTYRILTTQEKSGEKKGCVNGAERNIGLPSGSYPSRRAANQPKDSAQAFNKSRHV